MSSVVEEEVRVMVAQQAQEKRRQLVEKLAYVAAVEERRVEQHELLLSEVRRVFFEETAAEAQEHLLVDIGAGYRLEGKVTERTVFVGIGLGILVAMSPEECIAFVEEALPAMRAAADAAKLRVAEADRDGDE
jgi:prefoldin subunit 5